MIDINFILTVLIQVLCIFIFLTVFFFTYVKDKEQEVVKSQVDFFLDSLINENAGLLPEEAKQVIVEKLKNVNINTPANQEINKKIEKTNNEIKSNSFKIIAIFTAVVVAFVILSYILSYNNVQFFKNIHMDKIAYETVIIVLFVAITEFCFLKFLGSKYISIQPNIIKAKIFSNLASIFEKPRS